MKTHTLFKEFVWLLNTIRRAGRISLAEINEKWVQTEMSGGLEMARTTFNRHKAAIEDIFGIYIDCDRSGGYRYYIGNPRVLRDGSLENWMLSTLTLSNVVGESMSPSERVLAEPVSVDADLLGQIMRAMKEGRRLNIRYRQYGSPQAYWVAADPYCLRLFHQKWHLLGKHSKGKFALFCLNKIEEVAMQRHTFKVDSGFSAAAFFEPYFGVEIDQDVPTERIVIRAHGDERFELRDVPVHKSQAEKCWNDDADYADFEVRLKPTSDFIDYLLSRTGRLEVLSPQRVIDQLKSRYENI